MFSLWSITLNFQGLGLDKQKTHFLQDHGVIGQVHPDQFDVDISFLNILQRQPL